MAIVLALSEKPPKIEDEDEDETASGLKEAPFTRAARLRAHFLRAFGPEVFLIVGHDDLAFGISAGGVGGRVGLSTGRHSRGVFAHRYSARSGAGGSAQQTNQVGTDGVRPKKPRAGVAARARAPGGLTVT